MDNALLCVSLVVCVTMSNDDRVCVCVYVHRRCVSLCTYINGVVAVRYVRRRCVDTPYVDIDSYRVVSTMALERLYGSYVCSLTIGKRPETLGFRVFSYTGTRIDGDGVGRTISAVSPPRQYFSALVVIPASTVYVIYGSLRCPN